MKPYEGKDGLARDLARMKYEAGKVGEQAFYRTRDMLTLRGGWRRIGHNYVDIFVETLRAGPYFWGHIICWLPLIAAAKALWW
jgi:hypothetical protein